MQSAKRSLELRAGGPERREIDVMCRPSMRDTSCSPLFCTDRLKLDQMMIMERMMLVYSFNIKVVTAVPPLVASKITLFHFPASFSIFKGLIVITYMPLIRLNPDTRHNSQHKRTNSIYGTVHNFQQSKKL